MVVHTRHCPTWIRFFMALCRSYSRQVPFLIMDSLKTSPSELIEVESLPTARTEIEIQVATAKRWPRNISEFTRRAIALATVDDQTAAGCSYAIKRGSKMITGPSARLAEIVAVSWGNLRFGARIQGNDGQNIFAEGSALDLENNVGISIVIPRRITDRNGRLFSDDMITVTGNAAVSIALRNAVLKVVPKSFWQVVEAAAQKSAVGDKATLGERRAAAIGFFKSQFGVSQARVLHAIGRGSVEDITLEDLQTLTGLTTALRDGDSTADEAFPRFDDPAKGI